MKKTGIFNSEISRIVAKMGHKDKLAIVDMGFPIPKDVEVVDIVLDRGKPEFLETVLVVLRELEIEEIILADEIKSFNEKTYQELMEKLKEIYPNLKVTFVSHDEFKKMVKECKGVIRTGSDKPYSNVMLVSGVIF